MDANRSASDRTSVPAAVRSTSTVHARQYGTSQRASKIRTVDDLGDDTRMFQCADAVCLSTACATAFCRWGMPPPDSRLSPLPPLSPRDTGVNRSGSAERCMLCVRSHANQTTRSFFARGTVQPFQKMRIFSREGTRGIRRIGKRRNAWYVVLFCGDAVGIDAARVLCISLSLRATDLTSTNVTVQQR